MSESAQRRAQSDDTPQRPIGSGFDADTTATEVLRGVDLSGRLAIVTGGYSGIGTEVTRALSAAGATVIVPARRPAVARHVLGGPGLHRVEVEELDLADLNSVAAFVDRFLTSGRQVDLLINNAAVMANQLTRVGPGWESQFAINHLGHFALTNRLWPALRRDGTARVVSVSSRGHKYSPMHWDDLQWERGYDKWQAYGQAKTANILFAVELDVRGRADGVRTFAVYPAGVRSGLQRHLTAEEMHDLGWYDGAGNLAPMFRTAAQGAAGEVWAATSPQLNGRGGVYIERCDIAEVADPEKEEGPQRGVNPWAIERSEALRLWEMSAYLTDVNAFL
jgi:NAD(P)-dependent dehydrogenase (short-subunit alcohol dehydrogenase family)